MKSAVTLSLVSSLRGGPWIYWDDLGAAFSKAKALGYDGVELFTGDTKVPAGLEDAVNETGLNVAAVGTGAGKVMSGLSLTSSDADNRSKARAFIKDMVDMGAKFGAPAIIGSMQGRVEDGVEREQAVAWLAEGVLECGAHAGEKGVDLVYEPLNRYETNMFNQLEVAADWLDEISAKNVVLLGDLFHMNIEETCIASSIKAAARHLGHVHLADSNRRPGGFGHTEMGPIGAALREIGYSRYVSAEALCYPNADEAAKQTIDCYNQHFKG